MAAPGARRIAPGIVQDDTAPLAALAERVHALLAQWLRRGLRNLFASELEQGEMLARQLEQTGLVVAARLLRSACTGLASTDNTHSPHALNKLCLLLIEIARGA